MIGRTLARILENSEYLILAMNYGAQIQATILWCTLKLNLQKALGASISTLHVLWHYA